MHRDTQPSGPPRECRDFLGKQIADSNLIMKTGILLVVSNHGLAVTFCIAFYFLSEAITHPAQSWRSLEFDLECPQINQLCEKLRTIGNITL